MTSAISMSLALLARVLSTHYSHADLDNLFMLFGLEDPSQPGVSKVKRAMNAVTACERDPTELAKLLALVQHVVEERDLLGSRDRGELSGDAVGLLTSLERDGVLTPRTETQARSGTGDGPVVSSPHPTKRWDAFISHAREDKAGLVEALAKELNGRGLKIWYEDDVLQVGDSVRAAIDEGLGSSQYGIVVISHDYMRKDWTKRELDGLLALERSDKRLLPVWLGVTFDDVVKYSPTVAGRDAVRSAIGVQAVADALCRSMNRGDTTGAPQAAAKDVAPGARFLNLVNQLANGRVYAWVIVGGETEAAAKFSEDEIETFVGWLSSFEPGSVVTLANSAFVRVVVTDPVDKSATVWMGEAHHGPVINLLTTLELTPVAGSYGVTVSLPGLTGWWATVVGALPTLAGNLGLRRARLGFGLYPYGPNTTPVVGVDFGDAPPATRRAEYHQIPPWHAYTELFDPFHPPSNILGGAVRELLDVFSYGRADNTVSWIEQKLEDGCLKERYSGHATAVAGSRQEPTSAG